MTPSSEYDTCTTSGQRCDNIQSAATSTASVTVQRFAEANQLNATENNHGVIAAAALVQMHGTTLVGMFTDQARLATGSQSFPSYSRHQHMGYIKVGRMKVHQHSNPLLSIIVL